MHPAREVREAAIGHMKLVIEAAAKMGVPYFNTFMGGDASKTVDANWDDVLRASGRRSWSTPTRTASRSRSRTAR